MRGFLDFAGPVRALVLAGGPGIGKTMLWEAGVALAGERGLRVLSTRPRDAEMHLSLAGLGDLLDGVDVAALDWLPVPQGRALAAATLRTEAATAPEPRAVAAALLSVLRGLAAAEPLLVAVDDAQWLDRDSAIAIGFAARRLERWPVRFLLTTRSAGSAALEQAFESDAPAGHRRRPVEPRSDSPCAVRQLGVILPRRVLRRLYDAAEGNPLFALELGRALARGGPPEIDAELSVPGSLEGLLGARVDRLPPGQRRVLLAVALSAGASWRQLEAVGAEDALRAALDSGVLVAAGERVRPAHPLLAATAARLATPGSGARCISTWRGRPPTSGSASCIGARRRAPRRRAVSSAGRGGGVHGRSRRGRRGGRAGRARPTPHCAGSCRAGGAAARARRPSRGGGRVRAPQRAAGSGGRCSAAG